MSTPSAPSSRARWLVLGSLAAAAVAGVLAYRHMNARPEVIDPPAPDLSAADPAVRSLIEATRAKVREEPDSAAAWGRLGLAFHTHIFGREALACFEQAERLDPHNPRWPYFQALHHLAFDPPAAEAPLRRAVERGRDDSDGPRLRLAELLQRLGRDDEAREHFATLTRQNPAHPRANLGLARLTFQAGDVAGTRGHLEHALNHPTSRKAARSLAAEVHQAADNPAAARADRARAAELPDDPDWPDPYLAETAPFQVGEAAHVRLAGQMLDRNHAAEAIQVLAEVVRDYPRSANGWMLLGWAQFNLGRVPAAEEALRKSLNIDPAQPRAWMYLAFARLKQNDRADAVASLRKAVEYRPSYLEAHFNLGVILKEGGDPDGAISAFEAALRCQPLSAPAHAQLGEVLLKRGRTTEAVEHLKQAVELNPDDAASRKLLAEAGK